MATTHGNGTYGEYLKLDDLYVFRIQKRTGNTFRYTVTNLKDGSTIDIEPSQVENGIHGQVQQERPA